MKQKETKMQYCFPMESSCSKLLLLLLIDSSENQSMKGGGVKKGMGHSLLLQTSNANGIFDKLTTQVHNLQLRQIMKNEKYSFE